MARPADAPQHWEIYNTEAHVRETVLAKAPDVVLLQELPGLVPFVETHAMVGPNPKTHSGNLAILVAREMAQPAPTWSTVENFASLVTIGEMTIANVHLESGPGAADKRLEQLEKVVNANSSAHLLVAGDTNTRVAEEVAIASLGLSAERPPRPTWNSKKNRFRHNGAEFSAYFSRWFISEGLSVSNSWVGDNTPVETENNRFFVSDHFSCGGTVSIGPSQER